MVSYLGKKNTLLVVTFFTHHTLSRAFFTFSSPAHASLSSAHGVSPAYVTVLGMGRKKFFLLGEGRRAHAGDKTHEESEEGSSTIDRSRLRQCRRRRLAQQFLATGEHAIRSTHNVANVTRFANEKSGLSQTGNAFACKREDDIYVGVSRRQEATVTRHTHHTHKDTRTAVRHDTTRKRKFVQDQRRSEHTHS